MDSASGRHIRRCCRCVRTQRELDGRERQRERSPMSDRARVEAVINRIRPVLQADGADIELVDVLGACVSVRLIGLSQCRTVALSMHVGLSDALREEVPDFGELRLL